jgi:dihydrolipoamide dehydrogenase
MKYDVVVIGSGPGGYVCAIRCAQLGLKTAVIEKYPTLGGTCLNVGCIPSKALLDSSELFHLAGHTFGTHGIELENLRPNLGQMIHRKDEVVKQTTDGIVYLFKKNKIDRFEGTGSFIDSKKIQIKGNDGNTQTLEANNIVIATGSKPILLPFVQMDKKRIVTSTEALHLPEIPKRLILIGGGIIGLELGSVYARLGSEVTVVEYLDSIISNMDRGLGRELQKSLSKLGIQFLLKHRVLEAKTEEDLVKVRVSDSAGKEFMLEAEYCLLAVGRAAYTKDLGLENIGIKTEEKTGKVSVNEHLETSVSGVFAVGDVIKGAMLAHKAEDEGVMVAEIISGQKPHINYNLIPNVVYTWPEAAGVGKTEEELKSMGISYKAGSFPFKASARARASMDTEGFVKVLADKKTDEILGVHMIGPRAADLIAEAVVAMEFRASAADIGMISHAHPTYSEAMKEAALAASNGLSINI